MKQYASCVAHYCARTDTHAYRFYLKIGSGTQSAEGHENNSTMVIISSKLVSVNIWDSLCLNLLP